MRGSRTCSRRNSATSAPSGRPLRRSSRTRRARSATSALHSASCRCRSSTGARISSAASARFRARCRPTSRRSRADSPPGSDPSAVHWHPINGLLGNALQAVESRCRSSPRPTSAAHRRAPAAAPVAVEVEQAAAVEGAAQAAAVEAAARHHPRAPPRRLPSTRSRAPSRRRRRTSTPASLLELIAEGLEFPRRDSLFPAFVPLLDDLRDPLLTLVAWKNMNADEVKANVAATLAATATLVGSRVTVALSPLETDLAALASEAPDRRSRHRRRRRRRSARGAPLGDRERRPRRAPARR